LDGGVFTNRGGESGEAGRFAADPVIVPDSRELTTLPGGPVFDVRLVAVVRDGVGAGREHDDYVAKYAAHKGLGREPALEQLAKELRGSATQHRLDRVVELEHAVLPAVVAMRLRGVGVDRSKWEGLVQQRRGQLDVVERRLRAQLGLTRLSDKAVLKVLQDRGVKVDRIGRNALLPFINHPGVDLVIRCNQRRAFVNDQARAILRALDRSRDGRVRASIDQVGAVTGRMTTSEPNLLGLPRDERVRACFVPAKDHVFVVADYRALELRVAAALANEAVLLEMFAQGGDPHRATAARFLNKPEREVSDAERAGAKPVNFGALFGITPQGLVANALEQGVELSASEAARFLSAFRSTYPTLARWQDEIAADRPSLMFTPLGRIRRFGDSSINERLNFPVQATAADGMKCAIRRLYPELAHHEARLVLVVHDEMVVEVPKDHAAAVQKEVVEAMVSGMNEVVPGVRIDVATDVRSSWAL
jgi:DNA polymerase I-like protein with 3'-5' exonuclease and polymerase domains